MNNIKQQIKEIVKLKPKHYAKIIKNNSVLYNEIKDIIGNTIAEKTFNYLNEITSNICIYNQTKKFKSITEGYTGCGTAKTCRCVRENVSKKCKQAKSIVTQEQQNEITQKRIQTTLQKHGVTNNAQTSRARQKHQEFYQDINKVTESIFRNKQTKQQRYGTATYNNPEQIKKTFREKYQSGYWIEQFPDKEIDILHDKDKLSQLYLTCSIYEIAQQCNVHIQTVYRYLKIHNIKDPYKSAEEQEIVNFLSSIGISNIVRNSRSIIDTRKEIDIYLPDFNIAIEYNGVYWHHEDINHITRDYHSKKFQECEKKGIQLITIFSNFWRLKQHIVKEILRNKLGVTSVLAYARQCHIREVTTAETKNFLNDYHIQGYTTASYRYGLYFENMLVALMTFGKTRSGAGIGKADTSHELIRFASKGRIPGAASKLLKHFIKVHNPETIVSYSDNEWSTGHLYKTLNFKLDKEIAPSYWYITPKAEKFYHRYNFAKYKLIKLGYPSDMTERQITQQMGLLKIWDCGKRRWVMKC